MQKKSAGLLTAALVVIMASATSNAQEDANWSERISLQGDLRLRYEGIDEEGEENRSVAKYRARLALTAKPSSSVSVVMEIASGVDDPVSRNVRFDGGFTNKEIGFDLVYVDWAVADGWHVYGGKMKNPLFRAGGAPLVWDSDLNPEGFAVKYSAGGMFATVAGFSVEERSASDDSLLMAAQIGGKFDISSELALTAGVGYFGYTDTVGNEPFYDGSAGGNSVDLAGNYLYEYKNTEVFAQLNTTVRDWPLAVYATWVNNNEVDQQDTGYAFGASLGSLRAKGDRQFSWTYQDIEADAVIATFNDSDNGGGGTDASGHILKAAYLLTKDVSLGGTLFLNDVDRFQGTEHDYTRLQLDVQFSFK